MAKPSRSPKDARRTGSGSGRPQSAKRGAQARPGGSRKRASSRSARRVGEGGARIGWGRRAGVVLALMILGTSIVLAGQALEPRRSAGQPDATADAPTNRPASPAVIPPAPILDTPAAEVVTSASVDIAGSLPREVPRDGSHSLRIYVNGELARERRIPRRDSFSVRNLPLEQGPNTIAAAVFGPAGESLHSAPITLIRDDAPPIIRILQPAARSTIHTDTLALRGRTEAGAHIVVRNEATAEEVTLTGDGDGRFEAALAIDLGPNDISVRASDEAGNEARASVRVVREEGAASVTLTLSRESVELAALPASMTLTARMTDELGAAVDDAEVTFSLSPPGQTTTTFRATSRNGVAVWRGVRIPREGAVTGQGFATVLVSLPSGQTLQGSARFSIR